LEVTRQVGVADNPPPESGAGGGGPFSGLVAKIVIPVVVGVLIALIVALVTPLGDHLREFFFPTSAKVSGSVFFVGQPAAGAEITIDGHRANADEDGYFEIGGIGDGTHPLEASTTGALVAKLRITVERRMPELELDPIQLNPIVQLRYLVIVGTPEYELMLWLDGSIRSLNQVASASFELPPPLPAARVKAGSRARKFCYVEKGVVKFERSGEFGLVVADVKLRGGKSFELPAQQLPPTFSGQPPPCSVNVRGQVRVTRPVTTTTTTTTPPQDRVTVPNVLGQPLDTAKATLQGARLAVSVASVASSEPKGTVVSQDPGAGARVAPETTVRIGISKGGEATSEVPNVVGLDEASATAALVKAGFRVSVQRQTTSDAAQDGIVLSQYPSPGTRLAAGEKVAVTVGRYTSSP
jgi:hypothetical protein